MTVRLPKSLHRELRILSAKTDVPMNAMINEAVAEWLTRRQPGQETERR